ncbi:MoaD/ThiS family protein [Gilvimarinus agarilyticus]|uniref:MoaD/ThiS family protein n=1 Tax=Gilvimarinus agarilyticus TaxID=679259 RepID=UPI0005A0F6D8|nr:MoaD/ThiS family protein [Gilvimarinus agarilyticus]
MITVLFFAQLREQLACEEATLAAGSVAVAADLVPALIAANPQWAEVLQSRPWLLSVNQAMAKPVTTINDGDEVALFPPVTGG